MFPLEDKGLASEILNYLCSDATMANITLTHELLLKEENAEKSRYLMQKFEFSKIETVEDVEIWVRRPD